MEVINRKDNRDISIFIFLYLYLDTSILSIYFFIFTGFEFFLYTYSRHETKVQKVGRQVHANSTYIARCYSKVKTYRQYVLKDK